jgi:PhnB protein
MSTTNQSPKVEPYLFFDGCCAEAAEFYTQALGAEVLMLARYKDSPDPHPPGMVPPGSENKIMHARLKIGETLFMASDDCGQHKPKFEGFSLSLTAPNEAEAKKFFNALAQGGQVRMPLTKTFFSPCFGMVADRFGLGWMVIVQPSV